MWKTSFLFNYFTQYKYLYFYTFIAHMIDAYFALKESY